MEYALFHDRINIFSSQYICSRRSFQIKPTNTSYPQTTSILTLFSIAMATVSRLGWEWYSAVDSIPYGRANAFELLVEL